MRQRICIAIALSTKPRLILADEPTTALDVTIQAQVLGVLRRLKQEENAGSCWSAMIAVVSQTCSRLYVMYAGKVVESGTLLDLVPRPSIRTRSRCCVRCPIRIIASPGCTAASTIHGAKRGSSLASRIVPSPPMPVASGSRCSTGTFRSGAGLRACDACLRVTAERWTGWSLKKR